jgi:predicted alpha-1,2-mannosidase
LGRVALSGATDDQRRTFYSCLYRTQLFPRVWHEYDADGSPIHFSPYNGQVHDGVLYADNGFWDTYRTVYPLFALLMPERLAEILQGWTNACREGGWFPQWASPGYRACMVGTHIDAVMADAVVKGVTNFDLKTAYDGLVRHASEPGDQWGNYGRLGIADYLEHGYVIEDHQDHSVARSLDYAYDDWCLSQIARVLGHQEDAQRFQARASHYRLLYDSSVGFMRAKKADGSWREPFEEFAWGGPYVEGGPWQNSWAVPHDPAGLMDLMGGPEAFTARLDQMLTQEPHFNIGAYSNEIHEMTEMAAAQFGQYAQSNQPVHHVLALYAAAGRPDRMQYWTRRVMDELYTPDSFPGDEDNGEMSAWYILNALGFYPLCPGHPSYVLGAPLLPAARVQLPNGRELVIESTGNTPGAVYVKQLTINGQAHRPLWVSHNALMEGGHWRFEMSETPSVPELTPHDMPYSLSRENTK